MREYNSVNRREETFIFWENISLIRTLKAKKRKKTFEKIIQINLYFLTKENSINLKKQKYSYKTNLINGSCFG